MIMFHLTVSKKTGLYQVLFFKVPTRFELVIEVLQTFALPLGYGTIYYTILYYNFI